MEATRHWVGQAPSAQSRRPLSEPVPGRCQGRGARERNSTSPNRLLGRQRRPLLELGTWSSGGIHPVCCWSQDLLPRTFTELRQPWGQGKPKVLLQNRGSPQSPMGQSDALSQNPDKSLSQKFVSFLLPYRIWDLRL